MTTHEELMAQMDHVNQLAGEAADQRGSLMQAARYVLRVWARIAPGPLPDPCPLRKPSSIASLPEAIAQLQSVLHDADSQRAAEARRTR